MPPRALFRWTSPLLLPAALLAGCGSGPALPSGGTASPVPTAIRVLSGDTGLAVAGARVTGLAQAVTTDAGGGGSLELAVGTPLTIEAADFFLRETVFRGETAFWLWPIRADAGEAFIQELVYNHLVSDGSLTRPVSGVFLELTPAVGDDASASAVQAQAAAQTQAATGGVIPFVVTDAAPAGAVAISVRVDPDDPFLRDNPSYGAITRVTFPGHRISGGSTTYRGLREAAALPLVAHEMGHALGLGHPSQRGLMSPASIAQFTDLTPAEAFAVRMMLLRLPGNRLPDNDRDVEAASAPRPVTFACPWES